MVIDFTQQEIGKMYFYCPNHLNFMRLLRFARKDTPFCHCEESALADDEAIYFFAELTQ
ncbi:MAG: hypothetical protein GQ554_08315 [Deltaproteobacteria bacterium]|jgi:hypothetical protein|nr:hypothetical protein [Deltaproteobacteria bacterium]